VNEGEPRDIDAETLRTQVARLAATVLLIQCFPSEGSRDNAAVALAGFLIKSEMASNDSEIERYLRLICEKAGCADIEAKVAKVKQSRRAEGRGKELQGITGMRQYFGKEVTDTVAKWLGVSNARPSLTNVANTDAANGERLVRGYGEKIRYVYPWKEWRVWDGMRWIGDKAGRIEGFAIRTARSILGEAQNAERREDASALAKWATTSQSKQRIEAMIWSAQHHVPLQPEELDADQMLFNLHNGTVELQAGRLRDFEREDFISMQGGLALDLEMPCPRWLAFLERVMKGDAELVAFLQRSVGYTLTGSTAEQCFFLLYGQGANGKSTFIEVLRGIMGSYGRPTDFKALVDGNRGDGVRNDLAALRGLRLVTASEANRGQRFNEALVKQLTGGDKVTARKLYSEFFDFHPEFKLWLAVNHKPGIRGVDEAIWRRIHLIPFEVTIPPDERVKDLAKLLLEEEGAGIMAWAVRGFLEWQTMGLAIPCRVRTATQEYRDESNELADFFEEMVDASPRGFVTSADLYTAYDRWCTENAVEPKKKNLFGILMKERGFPAEYRSHAGHYGRYYEGLTLRQVPPKTEVQATPSSGEGPGHPSWPRPEK